MKLKSLMIRTPYSFSGEDTKFPYVGTVEYTNQSGEISLNLTGELTDRILEVVADALVESSKEVAATLTTACIEQRAEPALPAPEDDTTVNGDGTG